DELAVVAAVEVHEGLPLGGVVGHGGGFLGQQRRSGRRARDTNRPTKPARSRTPANQSDTGSTSDSPSAMTPASPPRPVRVMPVTRVGTSTGWRLLMLGTPR